MSLGRMDGPVCQLLAYFMAEEVEDSGQAIRKFWGGGTPLSAIDAGGDSSHHPGEVASRTVLTPLGEAVLLGSPTAPSTLKLLLRKLNYTVR